MSGPEEERPLTEVESAIVEAMIDEIQAEPISPAGALAIRLAQQEGSPSALLGAMRQVLKIQPDHLLLRMAAENLGKELSSSPPVILIERVRCAGRGPDSFEGRVYIEEHDGRLKPASGEELGSIEARLPGFLKNWRLPEDEY